MGNILADFIKMNNVKGRKEQSLKPILKVPQPLQKLKDVSRFQPLKKIDKKNAYQEALKSTLKFEGERKVKEPTGDISYKGIRQKVYDRYAKQKGIPTKNVSQLSPLERANFYKDEFWVRPKYNRLPEKIARVMFDYAVHSGINRATKSLQKVVGTKQDGIIGPKTLKKVGQYVDKNGIEKLKGAILDEREQFLKGLTERHSKIYGKYSEGWLLRIKKQRGEE